MKAEVDDKIRGADRRTRSRSSTRRTKARMGGKSFDDVKGDIEKALKGQKANERRGQFLAELPPRTT